MTFWIAAALLTLAPAAALFWTLTHRTGALRTTAEADIAVYRDQLAGVDRDAARGTISAAEAERSRVEISRRILEADRAVTGGVGRAVAGGPAVVPALMIVLALAGAVGLYGRLGAPGYADLPMSDRLAMAVARHADRPTQAEAEAEARTALPSAPPPDPRYADLMARLREAVAARPDDLTGLRLLVRNEAALGNYGAAAEAQAKIIARNGAEASAEDYAGLTDLYVLATDGYVSPEAETAANAALARDPGNGTARFYLGLMWAQTGRPDLAFGTWRALLEEGPEEAPWIAPIRDQIAFLAAAAGVNYMPPTGALKGPTEGDMAAAADMSAEDRMGMIRGMVEQLSDRLASAGGSVEEWSRLISSLGVLGETDRAKAAWETAQKAFEGQASALDALRQAAEQAGVAG